MMVGRQILRDRIFLAARSELPSRLAQTLRRHGPRTGLVLVGAKALSRLTELCANGVPIAYDPSRYGAVMASYDQPMVLDNGDGQASLFAAPTLTDYVNTADERLAAVVSPTGQVGAEDSAALHAVISACNAVASPRLVCTLPVASQWLLPDSVDDLISAVEESSHPVALVIVGEFDPFEDVEVLSGLASLIGAVGESVFLHCTDLMVVSAVAWGTLGGSVGVSSTLRHTMAIGQSTRRRKKPDRPGLPVFVPGINSFRDVDTLDGWFGDVAPRCTVVGCTDHVLNDFSTHNRTAAMGHNAAAVLDVAGALLSVGPFDRRAWIRDYWERVATEYALLKVRTGRRDIRPYGGDHHLVNGFSHTQV
jgi:hypothetical protein